jgi:hypothetical protein
MASSIAALAASPRPSRPSSIACVAARKGWFQFTWANGEPANSSYSGHPLVPRSVRSSSSGPR